MANKASPDELTRVAVAKVNSISTLPEITSQIIAIVDDPRSTPAQLNKIISHDPALVARTLKVVNSPFYGLPGKVTSVERAIVLLGFNGVKNIALAASLGTLFRAVTLCEGFTARDLWLHCVAVAMTSRQLARELKIPLADEAFLAGMIHDLGLLVTLQVWPDNLRAACDTARAGGTSFCQAERDAVGVDHQQLGQALSSAWKFPQVCQSVASNHHNPSRATETDKTLVGLVYMADTICCNHQTGFYLTAAKQQMHQTYLPQLAENPAALERLTAQLPALVDAAKQLC